MCNTITPYHAACAHYGPSTVSLYCVKAVSQVGHSRGCDETTDLGVENAVGWCPSCDKLGGRGSASPSPSTTSPVDGRGSPGVDSPPLPGSTATQRSNSTSSRVSRAEAAGFARSLLACLPASIPTVQRSASGVGLSTMDGKVDETPARLRWGLFRETAGCNQHWRAFDGRAFGEGVLG